MEHLPTPASPQFGQFEIPYLGELDDKGSFRDYPSRKGWPEDRHLTLTTNLDWTRFKAFTQTLLFFGLLHAFFGENFDQKEFLRQKDDGSIVLWTGGLNIFLTALMQTERKRPLAWQARLQNRDECLQHTRSALLGMRGRLQGHPTDHLLVLSLSALYECLATVNSSIQTAFYEPRDEDDIAYGNMLLKSLDPNSQVPLPAQIRQAVLETVRTSASEIQETATQPPTTEDLTAIVAKVGERARKCKARTEELGGMGDVLRERFEQRNWCPYEIQMIEKTFNTARQIYASQLDRPGANKGS